MSPFSWSWIFTRSVFGASERTGLIAHSVDQVASATKTTASGAEQTRMATQELSRMSSQLFEIVSRFKH